MDNKIIYAILFCVVVFLVSCFMAYRKGLKQGTSEGIATGTRFGRTSYEREFDKDLMNLATAQKEAAAQQAANETRANDLAKQERKFHFDRRKFTSDLEQKETDLKNDLKQKETTLFLDDVRRKNELREKEETLIAEHDKELKRLAIQKSQAAASFALNKRRNLIDVYEGQSALRECCGVYVIARSDGLIKIGETTDFARRFGQVQSDSKSAGIPTLDPIMLVPIDEGRVAVEKKVHNDLKEQRTSGEWFNVTVAQATQAVITRAWEQLAFNASARDFMTPYLQHKDPDKQDSRRRKFLGFHEIKYRALYECPSCNWQVDKCAFCGYEFGSEFHSKIPPENLCKYSGNLDPSVDFVDEALEALNTATAIVDKDMHDSNWANVDYVHGHAHEYNNLPDYEKYGNIYFAGSTQVFLLDESLEEFHRQVNLAKSTMDPEDDFWGTYEIIGSGNPVYVVMSGLYGDPDNYGSVIICDDANPCVAGRAIIHFCAEHAYDSESGAHMRNKIFDLAIATFATAIKKIFDRKT